MSQSGYYRYPTISGERIVFVCEDDLWTVPRQGGIAVRLTANLGMVRRPLLSPDGSYLAFVGREEGHSEVYCMPAVGGVAKRLTFMGSARVAGWSRDSQSIVFVSGAKQPMGRMAHLYSVSPEGGLPELLPYGLAHSVAFGPQGGTVIGRNTADEPAYWKRYRGGRVGVLWVDAADTGEFQKLLNLNGNLDSPMWLGDRIYFLSDHEGIGNLYSCTPQGQNLQRHTDHREYYARNASTDGQRIVYHCGADLFCFDPQSGTSQPIPIQFHSPRIQRQRKFVEAAEFLEHFDLHPEGHSVAITTRGKSFCFGNWEGAVFQLGRPETGRYRLTRWLNDGERLVGISDRSGVETLEIFAPNFDKEPEVLSGLDLGRATGLAVSPAADQVILANHRHELIWVDLASREQRLLDRSDFNRIHGYCWSPDGQWVAYSCATTQYTLSIKLCKLADGSTYCLTPPRFRDTSPSFDPEGKFIYFLSVREFNPVYDKVYFDLSFPKAVRPFLISLQAETPSPFVALPKPLKVSKPEEDEADKPNNAAQDETDPEDAANAEADNGEASDAADLEPLSIDFDGIQERIVAFPVAEGIYHQIWGIEGKVLFTTFPVQGSMDGRYPKSDLKPTLELYDFEAQKQERIATDVSSFRVGKDQKTLIYRSGNRLRVCGISPQDQNRKEAETGRKSGWLDLGRVRVSVNPEQEWIQMFREVWRLQQEQFWTPDMSGVDWELVFQRYRPLLDRIGTRAEFSDLVWEMQGELGTSHAYEGGGDYRDEPDYRMGFLGADFRYDPATDAYRIEHIIRGDSWTDQSSPLQQLGVNVKEGDLLLAVGGQRVSRHCSPQELLVNQARCEVALTFAPAEPAAEPAAEPIAEPVAKSATEQASQTEEAEGKGSGSTAQLNGHTTRTVTVKTLWSETSLRYREWVERNYRKVQEATEDQIGYIHIPDMGTTGFAEFHRYYFAEVHKAGLIVDVRYNRGGHVSQLILEKLARQRIGYDIMRWGKPDPFPSHSVAGPIVAITDEYAASDGDIFSHSFKLMQLGTLIGKRTWGGVIGISPRHSLVDRGMVTQPEFSFWFKDVGWQVENYGTDPDIEVEITPQDWVQGRDTQLESAIEVILQKLAENPVVLPDFSQRPHLPLPS